MFSPDKSERSEVNISRETTLGSRVSGSADSSGFGFSYADYGVLLESAGLREGRVSKSPVFTSNQKSTPSMQRCNKIRRHHISGAWDAERSGAHAPPFSDRAAKYIFRFSLAAFAVLLLLMCAISVPAAAVSVDLRGDAGDGYVLTAVDSSAAEAFDVSWMVSSNGADWVSALNCSNSSEFLLSSSEFKNLTGALSGFVCACSGTGDALVYSEPVGVSFVSPDMNWPDTDIPESDVSEDTAPEPAESIESDILNENVAAEPTESPEPEAPKDDDLPKPDMSQTLPVPELIERTDSTVTSDGHCVTVSGLMPADVFVRAIPLEQDLVDEILRVYFGLSAGSPVPESFFAYDITLVNEAGAAFQPEEFGVSVSVSKIEKLAEETPKPEVVEVVHVNTTLISPDVPDEGKTEVKKSDVDLSTLNEAVMSSVQVDSVNTDSVEFTANSFSWYIGTIGSGATLVFADGTGYSFKKLDGVTELSGRQEVTGGSFSFKVVPAANYAVWQVFQTPEDGTKTELPSDDGVYTATTVDSKNILVSVVSAVEAPGETITTESSSADVARIFDATAASGTSNNVVVTGGSGTYTVTLNNNILLKRCITVSSGVNLKILSAGDYTIKRSSALSADHMFSVSGTLEFGSGSVSDDTITYTFQDGTTTTAPVSTVPPEDDLKTVSSTKVNAVVTNTMEGTLTIDGGAVLSGGIFNKVSANPDHDRGVTVGENKDIVKVESTGVMKMWGGVTIQNHYCNNAFDGPGSTIYVEGTFYMYGGVITRCVLNILSSGDGGAFVVRGNGAKAYMYGGRIFNCGANTYGGFAVWSGASATVLGGVVENCYSKGADNTSLYGGGGAVGIYSDSSEAKLYFFGGEIARNTQSSGWWDESGATEGICQYDLKQNSGSTSYFFSGTVGVMNAFKGKLSIYRCVVDSISENTGKGTVEHIGQTYAVTLHDVVRADRTLPVTLTAFDNDDNTQVHTITTSGTGSTYVKIHVANGDYTIKAVSDSMEKMYSVTVDGDDTYAAADSRTMTVPVLASKTTTSVSIKEAGTGAESEGVIYYGYSDTDNSGDVDDWYYIESGTVKLNGNSVSDGSVTYADYIITFNSISGAQYFFIKAGDQGSFSESISPGLLVSTSSVSGVTITPSAITLAAGNSYTFIATVNGDNNPSQEVLWTLDGAKSPETTMTDGHLYLGAGEEVGKKINITATSVLDPLKYTTVTVTVGDSSSNIAALSYVDCYINSELRKKVTTFTSGDQNGYNYAAISAVDKTVGDYITISPQPSVSGAECKIYWATQNYVDGTTSFAETDTNNFELESGAHYSAASTEYCFIVVTALGGSTKSVYKLAVCKLGDVDSDNNIDIEDSACIGIYILKNRIDFLSEYQRAAADINCDTIIDSKDILLVNQYLVGDTSSGYIREQSVVP